MAQADDEGRLPEMLDDASDGADLAWLAERAEQLRIAAAAPKPILMGRHLIALGYKPSGKFGEWLAAAFEAQLDGAFTDLDGAIDYFKSHLQPSFREDLQA